MNKDYPFLSYDKKLSISLDLTPKDEAEAPESTYLPLFYELERRNISYDWTELVWKALYAKDEPFIEKLLGKWLQTRPAEEQQQLLWQACAHDRVDLLKRLVDLGANPTVPNPGEEEESLFPLDWACLYDSINCVDFLFPLTPNAEKIILEYYPLPKEWFLKKISLPALNPDFITPRTEKENLGRLVSALEKPLAEELYQSFLAAFCRINAFSEARDLVQKQQALTFRSFIPKGL